MDNDFNKELIEYLDKKFTGVDERFDEVDKKFVGVDEKFDRLFDVFPVKGEVPTKKDFDLLREDFSRLATGVDAYAHKADAFFQELVMLSNQTRRHEKWIQMLAEKLNVKLEY